MRKVDSRRSARPVAPGCARAQSGRGSSLVAAHPAGAFHGLQAEGAPARTPTRFRISARRSSRPELPCWSGLAHVDDVGLLSLEAGRGASAFFHVVNHRYQRHPTIVTTNRRLRCLEPVFGDAVVASASLDRLMHDAIVFPRPWKEALIGSHNEEPRSCHRDFR